MTLMELMVKIGGDTSGLDKALGGVTSKVKNLAVGTVKTAAKIGAATVAGVTAGLTAVTKQAVDAYGTFEQLEGGTKLLFAEGSNFILNQSKTAFRDVQMSQNAYLEEANRYAVSLKDAFGGDARAAAELADGIIRAEADIVAATGNSMESVQNGFAGLTKGNYTMLDNLGIGIKGTKEGMQQVIDRVNEWRKQQGLAADLTIESVADCEQAVVDFVKIQGMTGYAASEGASTIQGAMASAKGAYEDFLTAIGSGKGIYKATDNLVESVGHLGEQILPVVINVLEGVGDLIPKFATIINEKLPDLMHKILPPLTEALVDLIETTVPILAEMLPSIISTLAPALISAFTALVTAVIQEWPTIWAALKDAFKQLWDEIIKALNENFPGLGDMINEIVENLMKMAPVIITLIGAFEGLSIVGKIGKAFKDVSEDVKLLKNGFNLLGGKLTSLWGWITGTAIPAIGSFIAAAAPVIAVIAAIAAAVGLVYLAVKNWDKIKEIAKGVWNALQAFGDAVVEGFAMFFKAIADFFKNVFTGIWDGLQKFGDAVVQGFADVFSAIGDFFSGIWDAVQAFGDAIVQGFADFFGAIRDGIVDIWTGITDFLSGVWNTLCEIATTVWEAIKNGIVNAVTGVWNFLSNIWSTITGFLSGAWEGIKNIASDLWNGICNTISGLVDGVKTWLSDTWENIKNTASEKWNNLKAAASEKWESIKSTVKGKIEELKNNLKEKWDNIKEKASETWENIKTGLKSKIEGLKSAAREMAEGVKNAIKGVWDKAKEWGSELGHKMADGLKSAYGWLKDAASGAANTVSQWLHFTRPDVGPLHYYEQWMPDFMEGLANGIENNKWMLDEAMAGVSSDLTSAVTSISPKVNAGTISAEGTAGGSGDIIIPFYLDGTLIDERIVTAQQIHDFRSGGR